MFSAILTTPIFFRKWLEKNPDLSEDGPEEEILAECDRCNGKGVITCPHCEDGLVECPECREKKRYKIITSDAERIYKAELAREKELLERYAAHGSLPPIDGGRNHG